ncbi:uncharacterized protein KY384_001372 [Bacidia gigantensis]|uniref:uncharacterized protein n=1 Tax=Bacidia gigantensis TaxID=2732470 RepID=UPI001D046FC8|nr:uncharacterized protein KY384_001372 [Bacidia gigantensis]KAG8533631.1 hypothetical protein KY384_001372 [Bacidia gigantensis]
MAATNLVGSMKGIELFEDDLDLVRKMLAFCYGHDYEDSELLTKGQWILAAHTNALMYSLGDKYDVSGLRQVSSAGLERNLQCATARIVRDYPSPLSWIDGFQDLADAVYSGTPDSDDSLREPLIEFVYKQWANIGKLLPITESFAAIPQFVIDVIERHRKILNIARIECSEETRCRHTHCSTLEELKQETRNGPRERMEHSSHAHPPPDPQPKDTREASSVDAPSINASLSPRDSTNARRLYLRNVGFSVSAQPIRRMSPFFSAVPIRPQVLSPTVNNENSPSVRERQDVFRGSISGGAGNILQEIRNPPRRPIEMRRVHLGDMSDTNAPRTTRSSLRETSWYSATSNDCSPCSMSPSPGMRGLREISRNEQTTPSRSISGSARRAHLGSRIRIGSESYNASQYIDYLERQLVLAQAKHEASVSTEAKKARSTKIKSLSIENKNLRAEVEEVQRKYDVRVQSEAEKRLEFHTRVQAEVEKRLESEAEMKDRLDSLESEADLKDARNRELEWELECTKAKARDSEGLQDINQDLERRIEMLTHLLVQTPTKTSTTSASSSPSKRAPRPRSILLPKLPPSPGGARLSLTTVSETAPWQLEEYSLSSRASTSINLSSSTVVSPQGLGLSTFDTLRSPNSTAQRPCLSPQQLRRSSTMNSAPSPSRPVSFLSTSSYDTALGGSVDEGQDDTQCINRKRQMRRFTSGSKSLKPLVLPSTNGVQLHLNSAPAASIPEDKTSQFLPKTPKHRSEHFLPRWKTSPPGAMILQSPYQAPTAEQAHDQALEALEGKTKSSSACTDPSPSSMDSATETKRNTASNFRPWGHKKSRKSERRSLHTELEEAAIRLVTEYNSASTDDHSNPHPSNNHTTPEPTRIAIGLEPPSSLDSASDIIQGKQHPTQASETEPKLQGTPTASETERAPRHSATTKSRPSQEAFDQSIRLPHLLVLTSQFPWLLARRALTNAWSAGKNSLPGRVSRWFLRLVCRSCKRDSIARDAENNIPSEFFHPQSRHVRVHSRKMEASDKYSRPLPSSRYAGGNLVTTQQRSVDYGATWYSRPHPGNTGKELPPFLPMHRRQETQYFPCVECVEPSSRRDLRLWFQFSIAILLVIGVAIKNGPGVLVNQTPPDVPHQGSSTSVFREEAGDAMDDRSQGSGNNRTRDFSGRTSKTDNSFADSGYGSIMFAEALGPEDFQRHDQ